MSRRSFEQLGRWLFLGLVFLVVAAPAAMSQTSTGSIRGYVTDSSGRPLEGGRVVAVSVTTGAQREVTAQSRGYYALLGLVPGQYDVTARQIGMAPQRVRVRVLIGEVNTLDFKLAGSPIQLEAVTVAAASGGVETRTSEVATNVTPEQMQQLPTASRNFLDLAALAPGVIVSPDFVNLPANRITARTFTSGGGGPGSVNVFVDGTSLKNDLTGNGASGVAGQDASRGNPFPRNAIQEYRVITQNFKAEYQNASSAIITATTKSGGSSWTGNAFFTYQNKDLVALDSITRAQNPDSNKGFKPDYSRYLVGLSGGGPLIKDRLHFFGSYEGNYQNRSNPVTIQKLPAAGAFPALDTVQLAKYNGTFGSPFRETLLFGKLTYTASSKSTAELSFNNRHETDVRDFGGNTTFQAATNYLNNMSIGTLKYNYFTGPWLDELQATYSRFQRNPAADSPDLPHRTFNSFGSFGGADIGSYVSFQDFVQKGPGIRNDVTYTGFHWNGEHVIKLGVNANFLSFDINKQNNSIPQFTYADSVCRGCSPTVRQEAFAYRVPFQMVWANGPQPFLNTHNTQIGAYLQDDWSPTSRLTLNIGIRWDFESHMFNYDYVTPQSVIDTISRYNSDTANVRHPIDPAEYFTNGTQRHKFHGAFQPRLGFSYALDQENKTTLFGGFGIFYDRTFFDLSVDETLKLTYPTYTVIFADPDSAALGHLGPGEVAWDNRYLTANKTVLDSLVTNGTTPAGKEVWLISNNVKPPKSYQWNVGIRHLFGEVYTSVAYVGVRGVDGLVFNWANLAMKQNGTCCLGTFFFGHGFSNILYTTNTVKTWYDALQVQVNRPYRRSGNFGWGAGLSYTSGSRSLEGIDNPDDQFAFPEYQFIKKHPSNDEKSRLVANWIMDVPFAYGVQFGGLLTLGTGPRYDIGSRFNGVGGPYVPGGFSPPQYPFVLPGAWAYRELDLRLRKDFPNVSGTTIGVTVDVFNVLNTSNFTFDGNSGTPNGLASDQRRAQIGVEYSF